jgi:hypothetical protein
LAEPLTLCPHCGRVNDIGAAACSLCAEELAVFCPGCHRVNWSGAERCSGCGRELDPLAHAFRPVSASFELRRKDLIQNVSSLKEKGERESRARLETLREVDRRRQLRSVAMAERARIRDQRIITAVLIAMGVFVVFLIIALFIIG